MIYSRLSRRRSVYLDAPPLFALSFQQRWELVAVHETLVAAWQQLRDGPVQG